MSGASNRYCEALGISVPSLAAVRGHRDANTYALLIVALLEKGSAMTLADVAIRLVVVGAFASAEDAMTSLKRCRPARPPIYRDGEMYSLDPHDGELDLWVFRLGLRPPRVQRPEPTAPPPRPPESQRLHIDELDEAWGHDANIHSWSSQRIALAILDAHDRAMTLDELVAFVSARTKTHRLTATPATFRRKSAAISVSDVGTCAIIAGARELVLARNAVRDAVETARRYPRTPPARIDDARRAYERRRAAHADELASLRRVIVHAFPAHAPQAVVLVDVESRTLDTFVGDEIAQIPSSIARFDIITGVDIRGTLRALALDPETFRLAELGPPQKTVTINAAGQTLKISTEMLIQGSCRISRPLGDETQLRAYLAKGQVDKLVARLETDARSLFALHEYGRTHGAVRLRQGRIDEMFPAPWHHRDEPMLYHLMKEAFDMSMCVIAVVGPAPAWDDPWARAERLEVFEAGPYHHVLVDENCEPVDDRDVQIARLEATVN